MSTKLEVLKQHLQYVIENKEDHNWNKRSLCHCGSLLKATKLFNPLDIHDSDLEYFVDIERDFDLPGYYRYVFQIYKNNQCEVTNLSFTNVVQQLLSYGFTLDELINLEHLQDKRFLDLDTNSNEIKEADNLIQYLTNWINYEEQLVKATTKDKVTVSVTGL